MTPIHLLCCYETLSKCEGFFVRPMETMIQIPYDNIHNQNLNIDGVPASKYEHDFRFEIRFQLLIKDFVEMKKGLFMTEADGKVSCE